MSGMKVKRITIATSSNVDLFIGQPRFVEMPFLYILRYPLLFHAAAHENIPKVVIKIRRKKFLDSINRISTFDAGIRSGPAAAAVGTSTVVNARAMPAVPAIQDGVPAMRSRDEHHGQPAREGARDAEDEQVVCSGVARAPGVGPFEGGGWGVGKRMTERCAGGVESSSNQQEHNADDYEQPQRSLHGAVHSLPQPY